MDSKKKSKIPEIEHGDNIFRWAVGGFDDDDLSFEFDWESDTAELGLGEEKTLLDYSDLEELSTCVKELMKIMRKAAEAQEDEDTCIY